MHALAMIDRAPQSAEIVPTAKTAEKSDQQFGKVLNEKQQSQPVPEERQTEKQAEMSQKEQTVRQ
ncbi:MAG: hypothetical protein OQK97_12980, partial [Deltaproteobacteria bacterium]|nr:hypothetical protein [Deltaproteobacteria bacterium]